jgi:hypothetical protein
VAGDVGWEHLQVWCAGGVVGDDGLDDAVFGVLLQEARANGVKITAETCFHYLSLAAEEVRDGDTRHKRCARGDWEQDEPKKEYFRWHRSRMKKVSRPGK